MIEIRNLHKKLGTSKVLNGLNLDINDGEIFTLLGGSGAGKSVFLKNIIGLISPDSGSIKIDGQEIVNMPQKKLSKIQSKFGMMFQGGALFDSLTVKENVAFGMERLTSYSKEKIEQQVREYLDMVGLKGVENYLPEDLSIGMKRRVALARAIAIQPRYILYDEPTTGLDPIMTDVICELFIELQKKLPITSIIVTHDLTTAFKVSDRIGLLYNGVITEVDETAKFRKSNNAYVEKFIGIYEEQVEKNNRRP